MKNSVYSISFSLLFFFAFNSAYAQTWDGVTTPTGLTYRSGNVAIGTTTPSSTNRLHVETPTLGNNTAAIYGEILQPIGFADRTRAIYGRIDSGFGWTYGVYGSATNVTPSNDGRAFGVFGAASNSTPGFNYGGFFQLTGDNSGAALVAIDGTTPEGLAWLQTNGGTGLATSRAGLFLGDVEISNRVSIACSNFSAPAAGTVNYQLFVNGGIRALELHIDNASWCDYVFDKQYELKPLNEVATFIEENGHLHNTKSAKQIKENGGIEISDVTRNQQEKIEEIFLHLISMNKQIEQLKTENTKLKKALEK